LQSVLAVRIDRAITDQGQVLAEPTAALAAPFADSPGEEIVIIWDGMAELPANLLGDPGQVVVRLRLPGQPARHLRELHGTIALQVQTAPEPLVTVDGILQAVGRTVRGSDGSWLKVIEVQHEEKGELRVQVEAAPPHRELILGGVPARVIFSRGWWGGRGTLVPLTLIGAEQLVLLDSHGRKVPPAKNSGPEANGNGKAWEFTLIYPSGQGEPARLVYIGRRTVTIEVPFLLKDVPLP
jgi:hypothetical protein